MVLILKSSIWARLVLLKLEPSSIPPGELHAWCKPQPAAVLCCCGKQRQQQWKAMELYKDVHKARDYRWKHYFEIIQKTKGAETTFLLQERLKSLHEQINFFNSESARAKTYHITHESFAHGKGESKIPEAEKLVVIS